MKYASPYKRYEFALKNIRRILDGWRSGRLRVIYTDDVHTGEDGFTYSLSALLEIIYNYVLVALDMPLPVLAAGDFPLDFPADQNNLVLVDDEEPEEN